MSAVTEPMAADRPRLRLGDGAVSFAMALGATALSCLMNAPLIIATLHGQIGDPDDAMRLVEVRAWLAGQSWFDMTAMRIDPPVGSFMHWSRLVDLPLAMMIRLFGLVTDASTAERLASVAVPTLWLVLLYVGIARLAVQLVGRAGRLPALIGMILSGATLVQFAPGRVGHHAPETVTLVFALTAAFASLNPRHARQAGIVGALVALAFAMSLETLPFQMVLVGTLVVLWAWQGKELAAMLAWLAIGLLVALPFFFILTVHPDRWFAPTCDAYGAAHLGGGLIGAAGLLFLSVLTPHLRTGLHRLAACIVTACLAALYVALAYPGCLRSPFAGVDPLVRDLWLSHVAESFSLPLFLRLNPMIGLAIVCPVVLGLVGHIAATLSSRGIARRRCLVITVLSGFGLGLAFWQVRVIGSVTPLAVLGGVYLVTRLRARLASAGLALAAAFAPAGIVVFSSTAWALALPSDAPSKTDTGSSCLMPAALAPLAGLRPATAVAPIDSGSHLLEATNLSVFAAPYHRNDDGNGFAFKVFMAAPSEARALLLARRVGYVITCPGMADMRRLAERSPDGLAARLAEGRIPAFLVDLNLGKTPYTVYAVQPSIR